MGKQTLRPANQPADAFDLRRLQQWMQSVISHADGIETGIASEQAREQIDVSAAEVEQVIERSNNLTSIERLGIYGNAYYSRLTECLRESFPAMVYALGEELFNDFSFGYLQRYPSASYSLCQLGDNFAKHLEETRPDAHEREEGHVDWPDFLIDLATLEWNIEQIFDGPGTERQSLLKTEQLLAIPVDRWAHVVLEPVPCLRMLAFRFPVNDYFTQFRKEQKPEIPAPGDQFVALTRRQYVVWRLELDRIEYKLLGRILQGETIGQSIEAVAITGDWDLGQLAERLKQWFQKWTAADFFRTATIH